MTRSEDDTFFKAGSQQEIYFLPCDVYKNNIVILLVESLVVGDKSENEFADIFCAAYKSHLSWLFTESLDDLLFRSNFCKK